MVLWIAAAWMALPSAGNTPVYFPPPYADRFVPCPADSQSGPVPVVSRLENKWFSEQLAAAGEPSLYSTARLGRVGGTTVRFTWLPSFHHSVTVRIVGLRSARPRLIARQLSGAGGYAPGTVDKRIDRPLSPAETKMIEAILTRTNVLEMPARECNDGGLDGADWLVESVDAHGYRFRMRWSPEKGGYHEFGLAMLKLTGWKFEEIY